LAVIFLAVLGAGAGYSLGSLSRTGHTDTPGNTSTTGGNQAGGNTGGGTTDGGNAGTGATAPSAGTGTRCPQHTEELAGAGPLTQVLYLHTAQSEVWVCKSGDGTLFYQGHRGQPGGVLRENDTALFLRTVEPGTGDDAYVATNTDPSNGHVTRYHVNKHRLIIEYVWSGKQDQQDAVS
jgi:hypothetical protein